MISTFKYQIDQSPTASHVVANAASVLSEQGFIAYQPSIDSTPRGERGFVVRNGTIIAWRNIEKINEQGVRIIGAHTDSPGLHIKPRPDMTVLNWQQLQVEVYGGPLLNSWLDRDLGIAGHIVRRDGTTQLFASDHAVARIPQLAIHLDREVNDKGLILNRHQHLTPVWSGDQPSTSFDAWLSELTQCDRGEIASWSAQLFDTQHGEVIGRNREFFASSRIDNQISCWAAIDALASVDGDLPMIIALFDHEEVGSESASGAAGPMLEHVLEFLSLHNNGSRSDYLSLLQHSHCLSVDNAHAVHPNYVDRHELNNAPLINHGVVVKHNANQRYATAASSLLPVISAAEDAVISLQTFSSRNNIACGSTIGPIAATRLGIDTVDIGVPQLSMHSVREMCGTKDPVDLVALMRSYLKRT
jgi:aspartyl aminopeptidase